MQLRPPPSASSRQRSLILRSDTPAVVVLALTLIVGLLLALVPNLPAFAAPVYEIEGRWAANTPAQVSAPQVVTAEWRVNVNDDQEAPANTPVENVTFTATVGDGRFTDLPDVCLTAGVTPASSISADGSTLVCNLGTQTMGTAIAVQTPITSEGASGDAVTLTGAIGDQTVTLPEIPISGKFGMDITWTAPSDWTGTPSPGVVDLDYQWTLNLLDGSEAGPNSVSYDLTMSRVGGTSLEAVTCDPFSLPGASGHPWSGGSHPADQMAPFPTCTLTPTADPNVFRMTLTGIDYSLTQVPTKDSSGANLPTDRSAIASGRVVFRVNTTEAVSVGLSSSTPTYTSSVNPATTAQDVPTNNTSSKAWTPAGGFAAAYIRAFTGNGGTNWDNSYEVAPGTVVLSQNDLREHTLVTDPSAVVQQCTAIDTRYSTLDRVQFPAGDAFVAPSDYTVYYYVGTDASVTPGSGAYDPDAFTRNCDTDAGNWVTTPPADLSTVKAVRSTFPASAGEDTERSVLQVLTRINDDAPAGADVWTTNSYKIGGGAWITSPNDISPTPGALYPTTRGSRDVVRVVSTYPTILKSVDRSSVKPGEPFTYSLQYAANGGTSAPETIDGYVIRDTLPAGVAYVSGSATPEPVVTVSDGRQILTWTLDDVPTNQALALTYQATVVSGAPGTALRNTVTSAVGGVTSAPAAADVVITTNGSTTIGKSADAPYIPNVGGDGVGAGSWTVTIRSNDPVSQSFTDTIDVLPYVGDGRGTSFSGSYALTDVTAVAGATVYYTDADPSTLDDDPADASNGAAGTTTGNTVGWSTTRPANPTAVRVIGPALAPGATQAFTLSIETDGVEGGDVLVNRAQGRAEHTELVMRTSAPITVANYYSAALIKEVQDAEGEWHNANTVEDYPSFRIGDTVTYRIRVENTGQGTLRDLVITDDLYPEGSFTVAELAPGADATHEFSIVLAAGTLDTVVNTACATAATPSDSQVAPTINCDPAGIEVVGDPEHSKSLLSATPIGDGQWEVVYGIEVTNASNASTSYSLDDVLHFTDEAAIVSAEVTASPDGVTLADPAWDGQDATRIVTGVPLRGNDDAGYAPHVYELTVIATAPLQVPGAGGDPDPTACASDGDDNDTAFNNTSVLTDPDGVTEEDQACAELPSIDIVKSVSEGPTPNGDGTWTVLYDLVVTNDGAASGTYDLSDAMNIDGDVAVESAEVVTAPEGVTANPDWTGRGTTGAPENVISTGVALGSGAVHTYQVEAVIALAPGTDGAPVVTSCDEEAPGSGTLTNTAGVVHNGLEDSDDACIEVGTVDIDKTVSAGPTANDDGTWTITYDIDVQHLGAAPAEYDLSDRLQYGDGIEVLDAAVVTTPAGVTAEESWTGLGADGSDDNVITTDQTLPVGATHRYQVEVTFELADDIAPIALECLPGGDTAGGLLNSATAESNGTAAEDDACASVPLFEFSKEISAGPTANGDGTWTIDYELLVENVGAAPGTYDLTDRLEYGEGIDIRSADIASTPDGVDDPAGWTGQGAAGSDANIVATDTTLEEKQSHTYLVRVVVSIDTDVATPGTVACAPGNEGGRGLFNTAGLTHNGETIRDDACADLPLLDIVKSLSGAVTPVAGEPGVYDAVYEITVTNSGPGASQYVLEDELSPGEGVEIVGIQGITTDAADPVGINPDFDGIDDVRIVTEQPIAGAAPTPVVHTYTVTVRYAVDLAGIEVPEDTTCTTAGGVGTLGNDATLDWNGIEDSDDACIVPGKSTLDKSLVSATPIGDGEWEVVYDLTVGNTGTEATTYDLDDEFRFAPAVGVDSADVAGPDGVELDGSFDGEENTRIATDVRIAGIDDEGYAPHVYRVTVIAQVPLDLPEPDEDGTGDPGCAVPGGVEQGLNNRATLTDETGGEITDEACAPLPEIGIVKSLVGKPSEASNGDWTVLYDIVVTNHGQVGSTYTLTDRLRFGAGIEVESAEVTGAPKGVTVADSWTGQGAVGNADNVISSDVALAAGGVHTYRVRVIATIDTGASDRTTATCPTGADGNGGFANTAAVTQNGLSAADDACAVPPPPPLAITGADVMWPAGLALAVLVLGMLAMLVSRRRSET